jgi:hypothetical protein
MVDGRQDATVDSAGKGELGRLDRDTVCWNGTIDRHESYIPTRPGKRPSLGFHPKMLSMFHETPDSPNYIALRFTLIGYCRSSHCLPQEIQPEDL